MQLSTIELSEQAFDDIQQVMESTVGDVQFSDFTNESFLRYVAQLIKVSYAIGVRDGVQRGIV